MGTNQKSGKIKSRELKGNQLDALYLLPKQPITDKITIDIKDLLRFCFCPRYYDYYKDENVKMNIREIYNEQIYYTLCSYLFALQNNTLDNTLGFLKYQWGKNWIKYKNYKKLFIISSTFVNDTYESFRKSGIDVIFKFDEMMLKDRQYPIIVNHKYEFEILPNIIITGRLEYVRELTTNDDQKVIQVVKLLPGSRNGSRFTTNMAKQFDLEMIVNSYIFKELFDVEYFQSVLIDISSKKQIIMTYNDKQYDMMKQTIKSVAVCLQNDLRCVSPDNRCYNCAYRNVCIKTM